MRFMLLRGTLSKGTCLNFKTISISCAGSRRLKINLTDTTKKLKPSGRKRYVVTDRRKADIGPADNIN